jgi:hypothetical protein
MKMASSGRKTVTRHLIGAAFAMVAFMMSGCAFSPVTAESRLSALPNAVQLKPGQGILAVKLAVNRPQVSMYFKKWKTLLVRNEDLDEDFALYDRSDFAASHAFFVDSLPPGTYSVREIKSEAASLALEVWSKAKVDGVFPKFTVAAGRLTDLGTIAYIRAHYPSSSRQHDWGQAHSLMDRPTVLRQLAPALGAALGAEPSLGWEEGERLQALQQGFESMRSVSMQANSPARLPDGTVLLGEAFGQIAVRTPGRAWQYIQTPTALPIRAIHAAADGSLLAGSDDSVLVARGAGQSKWQFITLPIVDASVIDIGPLPGTDELLVVLQTRDRFVGLSTSRVSPGQWTEQFARPRALFATPSGDAQGFVMRTGEHLVFASGGNMGKQETVTYDSKARSWKAVPVETTDLPLHWALLPDGRLARFDGYPITGGRFFTLSSDGGAHWEKGGELGATFAPLLFVSNETGYAVRGGFPIDVEFTEDPNQPPTLWRTDDTGRSWKEVARTPAMPRRLIRLGGPEHLGYASGDGKFFSSTDGGKSWTLDVNVP